MIRRIGVGIAGLLGAMLLQPSPGQAQLQEVRQTVYGMDCAPCAFGVERRMGNLEGVTHVTLSLNQGFAELRFGEAHATTLARIRREIRDGGFGPRDARVRLRGSVTREDGVPVLATPAGERFRVEPGNRAPVPEAGMDVGVLGTVTSEPDEAGRWVLRMEPPEGR